MTEIKNLVIPLQRSQIGFSPLIKTVPFELWSLAGRPLIEYLVDEAIQSGINEITFVGPSKEKNILNYFNVEPKIEKTLQAQNSKLKETFHLFHQKYQEVKFNFAFSDKILSDGAAILQAKNSIKKKAFAITNSRDLIFGETPSLKQLIKVFHASERPIIGLKRISASKINPQQAVVKVEKIAQKVYKLRELNSEENDLKGEEVFTLAGRCILTNQVLEFAKEVKKEMECPENLTLEKILNSMLQAGKPVYGYEVKGRSFDLLSLRNWRKAEASLILNDFGYEKEWQKYFSDID